MSKQWPNKTIIGLTGNIATGKSAVMRFAAEEGALTLDADEIVHDIMNGDPSMQAAIAVAFGPEVRRSNGTIDRLALASIVFDDEEALRDLEMMMHPAVRQEIIRRVNNAEAEVVMIEAIKLLEGELVDLCDQVWVTDCALEVQIQRLMVCRGLDAETAAARVDVQNPQQDKVERADVVIKTDGIMAETKEQFERAWHRVLHGEEVPPKPQQKEAKKPEPPVEVPLREAPSRSTQPDVTVRRARPSDIPGILLLMHKASAGRVRRTRAEMLMSFSERSYLIGQTGAQISTIVGWNTDSTTAVCIDQFYVHPLEAASNTGPPVLAEIERSARELICEVAFAFLPTDAPDEVRQLLTDAGYEQMEKKALRRAWQQTVKERQPDGTFIMAKVLRDIRVA